jgi:hypothetical protein
MTDTQIPAGWYADPSGDTTKLRYWNGAEWTEQTSDATASGGQAPQPTVAPVTPASPYAQPTTTPPPAPASPYPQPIYQQTAPGAPVSDQSGAATGALVCGIVGIPGALLSPIVGIALGIIALVLGTRSRTSSKKNLAIVGMVLGVIALIIAIINWILGIVFFSDLYF